MEPVEQRRSGSRVADDALGDLGGPGSGTDVASLPSLRPEMEDPALYDRRWVVLIVALVGFFSTGFLITIVSASIPRIAEDLRVSDASASWVLTGAMLTFGVATPLMGRVADTLGHKRMYVWGLLVSTASAALIALSWNIASLVGFRVLWALAGAASGPASMAIIMRCFPPRERVRAMGWWSFVAAGAPVLGVVAGGPAVEAFSWRVVFAAQIPLSLLAVALGIRWLPPDRSRERTPIDFWGGLTVGCAAAAVMFGVNRGAEWGWSHSVVLVSFALAPAAAAAFVWVERRASAPLLPRGLLSHRNFVCPIVVHILANFCYMGAFFVTPFLLQRVFDYGVARTAFFMLPRPIAFTLSAPVAGAIAIRVGERKMVMAAMCSMAASMVFLSVGSMGGSAAAIVTGLVLSGIALGSASPSLSSTVANAAPPQYLATAGAASNLASTLGSVVGMETLRALAQTLGGTGRAYAAAYALAGLLPVLALVPASLIRSLPRRAAESGPREEVGYLQPGS